MKTIQINTKQVSNDYPYGRLKCTATFAVEFNPKKGFRSVFQTINPKTDRLNAPKFGTYGEIVFMMVEEGFVTFDKMYLHGADDLNKAFRFVEEHFDLFTPEQINYLTLAFLTCTKVDFRCTVSYGGAKAEEIKEYYTPVIEKLVEINNTGINLFKSLELDTNAIKSKKPIYYSPFKIE